MLERSSYNLNMNTLDGTRRAQIVAALVEGNSIRATSRMTGASKNTIVKLLADLGHVCAMYQDVALRNLPCRRIQVDEIWSFVYAKAKNVTDKIRQEQGPEVGNIWTWTAICADTKLVPVWSKYSNAQRVSSLHLSKGCLNLASRSDTYSFRVRSSLPASSPRSRFEPAVRTPGGPVARHPQLRGRKTALRREIPSTLRGFQGPLSC